jgi:putative flippase GtrA
MRRDMTTPRPLPLRGATPPQFLRYATAGVAGTAVQYLVLIVLVQAAAIGAVVASTLGAVAGALVNYHLNHRYTFNSDKPHARALPRFATVALAGVAVNAAVLALMLAFVTPHYLLAQLAATAAVLLAGFAVNRAWTF